MANLLKIEVLENTKNIVKLSVSSIHPDQNHIPFSFGFLHTLIFESIYEGKVKNGRKNSEQIASLEKLGINIKKSIKKVSIERISSKEGVLLVETTFEEFYKHLKKGVSWSTTAYETEPTDNEYWKIYKEANEISNTDFISWTTTEKKNKLKELVEKEQEELNKRIAEQKLKDTVNGEDFKLELINLITKAIGNNFNTLDFGIYKYNGKIDFSGKYKTPQKMMKVEFQEEDKRAMIELANKMFESRGDGVFVLMGVGIKFFEEESRIKNYLL